jgi:hypothetical protein
VRVLLESACGARAPEIGRDRNCRESFFSVKDLFICNGATERTVMMV